MAHRSHACHVEFGLGSEQIIKPSYQLHSAWPAACPGSQSCLKIKGLLSPEAKFASASPPALRGASSSEQLQVSPLCPQVNPTFISYHPLQAVPDSGAELGETVAGVTCTSIGATEGGGLPATYTPLKIRDGNVSSRKSLLRRKLKCLPFLFCRELPVIKFC